MEILVALVVLIAVYFGVKVVLFTLKYAIIAGLGTLGVILCIIAVFYVVVPVEGKLFMQAAVQGLTQ